MIIDKAAESLIRRRRPRLDFIRERLEEARARRIIGPVTTLFSGPGPGARWPGSFALEKNGLELRLDLGPLKNGEKLRPASPIYSSLPAGHFAENARYAPPKKLAGGRAAAGLA